MGVQPPASKVEGAQSLWPGDPPENTFKLGSTETQFPTREETKDECWANTSELRGRVPLALPSTGSGLVYGATLSAGWQSISVAM